MTTGQRIKEARKRVNMTQAELAQRLDIPFQSISQWERDVRKPKYETLRVIAEALDVTVGYFLGHDSIDAKQFLDALRKGDIRTVEQMSGLPEGSLLPMLTPEDIADIESAATAQKSSRSWESEEKPSIQIEIRHDSNAEKLLECFSKLNDEGRCVALDRVQELTEIPKYQK